MKILIEGESYPISVLDSIFDDPKFYNQNGNEGTILSVGYYHSFKNNELVYMLPKVFMRDNDETVFGLGKEELLHFEKNESFKHKEEYNWVRQLSIYFYKSLLEYKRRIINSNLVNTSQSFILNTNIGDKEYSYLDLLLSFLNFYKKNKNYILYLHKEYYSDQVKNPKWEKTIRNNLPILTSGKTPVYIRIRNTKKIINREEELIIYFFSILNYFNEEHNLFIQIDNSYKLYTGSSFKKLQKNGLSKLKKIKHRYFSNTLRSMYHLCKIYFSQTDNSSEKKKREEFLSVKSYNLVFEDMIDKLFSDQLSEKTVDGVSMKDLKYNEDGKIIDHIYDYQSIIDTSNIFYIGDSKYYKSNYEAGRLSKYKQFTYAKNVIQFNIDLLNEGKIYKENIRYRDELTEGYNITPNFFIYGYIQDEKNFNEHLIEKISEPIKSSHFPERLFDRDTLFVHQYKINFLYVLRAYSNFSMNKILRFRKNIKATFRNNIIDYFNDESKCEYILYKCKLNREKLSKFVDDNFRLLNGKCFRNNEGDLLLAVHSNDKTLKDIMAKFDKIRLEKQNMEFTPI